MNTIKLNDRTSYSWLADDIRRSRGGKSRPSVAVKRLSVPRLPADFSPDNIILEARQLRALHLGELLGRGARAAAKVVSAAFDRVFGDSSGAKAARETHEVKQTHEVKKAA